MKAYAEARKFDVLLVGDVNRCKRHYTRLNRAPTATCNQLIFQLNVAPHICAVT